MTWKVHDSSQTLTPEEHAKQSLSKELKDVKREMDKLDVPDCIKPDVCFHLGYLAGYTESSSIWSFFSQFSEVLLRYDGSALPRCGIEIFIATALGFLVCIFALEDDWTPKRSDGTPILHDPHGPVGHSIVGSLLACACAGAHYPRLSPTLVLEGRAARPQLPPPPPPSLPLTARTRAHVRTSPSTWLVLSPRSSIGLRSPYGLPLPDRVVHVPARLHLLHGAPHCELEPCPRCHRPVAR